MGVAVSVGATVGSAGETGVGVSEGNKLGSDDSVAPGVKGEGVTDSPGRPMGETTIGVGVACSGVTPGVWVGSDVGWTGSTLSGSVPGGTMITPG